MARTDQLGAPAATVYVDGENTLHRYWLQAAGVATGVAAVNITGVQTATPGPVTYKRSTELFHQGGGDKLMVRYDPEHTFDLQMFAKDVPAFLAAICNVTPYATTAGYYGLPLTFPDWPIINIEMIYRATNNTTVYSSVIFQDLILKEFAFPSANENNLVTVPFYSKHIPLHLDDSAEPVYDIFSGDGSTTAFTLSQTPQVVTDVSVGGQKEDFVLDNLIYCKVKTSTQDFGTRYKSGITLSGTTLTFSTAPVASSRVEVFYIK